jgi:hypothetical protein
MTDTNVVNQGELEELWNYFEFTLSNIYNKLIYNKDITISPNIQILLYNKILNFTSNSKKHKEILYDKICDWANNKISSLIQNEKNKILSCNCQDDDLVTK